MEKTNRELESLVNSQNQQIKRYETRLKDVVAAYKGLLKEKEALEASLSALNVPNEKSTLNDPDKSEASSSDAPDQTSSSADNELKVQIGTLMNSLATLSAEKSRMEASFQADKKHMRQELQAKDKAIKDLNEKVKAISVQHGTDLEKAKSKLIVERHEREKEVNDHMLMVRELQKLLSDERHLKDNLDMQLNDLKMQFSKSDFSDGKVKELTMELEQAKRKLKEMKNLLRNQNSAANSDNLGNVKQMQSEVQSMKQQHMVHLKNEQRRANLAEEVNRKMSAVHEEKVALLEERLAELSSTVGSYDRLRQIDQENIFKLKEKIAQFELNNVRDDDDNDRTTTKNPIRELNVELLMEEMLHLKKVLLVENAKLECPQDLSKIFSNADDHTECMDEHRKIVDAYACCKRELETALSTSLVERNHIKTLQDKIQVLNRNIDEQEEELKRKATEYANEIRSERKKWKETNSLAEMDYRGKLAQLEQQLQKQRERSLVLLEEKEQEIKALKTSFEVLIPSITNVHAIGTDDTENGISEKLPAKYNSSHLNSILSTPSGSATNHSSEYHMLHYVHELSRKEVEITSLRKAKHLAESSLRQALQDKVTQQQDLHDRIMNLEENIDRLERCKSREGANLEYLKNVFLSFLVSNDIESRRHMVNAIGAVLKFSPTEVQTINNYFSKRDKK
ncbi:GRIP and coiled-coil domain-containing protein 1 [Bradysia coprophila]|uniref:GRIP and coiled-coil domain-containing protein 1 n=1 Tax=Bradysia coprophila TaxID=38358 RepID=UPI00187DC9B7|nr:GRIP and coiled-coil domain-containing protein 1 [Bradysia coprophila]